MYSVKGNIKGRQFLKGEKERDTEKEEEKED